MIKKGETLRALVKIGWCLLVQAGHSIKTSSSHSPTLDVTFEATLKQLEPEVDLVREAWKEHEESSA